ncbi:MAG: hypothetical protein E7461_02565 [Ruminococcaceae bacterium]|nr:hypothetical protein [Oscillospiraceae bacterium]
MKIYKMTATFGKLQNETLELKPGLNILQAPNEWGKSTWCAFLVAMLYGVDTKERTTKDTLAVKERYAPWSGVPMSGSMDICWENRDITIQRAPTKRIPMGDFKAFETKTGLPVPELTAENCGEMLLGVDKNVFLRTGFLQLADLPISDDAALRSRLNALVTTGDESGDQTLLTEKLKELRNKCRHNKTGLLPAAEAERDELLSKMQKIDILNAQKTALSAQIEQLQTEKADLQNHLTHLSYGRSQQEYSHLHTAEAETESLRKQVAKLEEETALLPPEEETRYKCAALADLQHQWALLQEKPLPQAPTAPEENPIFAGLSGEEAVTRARQNWESWQNLQKPTSPLYLIIAAALFVIGVAMAFVNPVWIATFICVAFSFVVLYSREKQKTEKEKETLCHPYGSLSPENWLQEALHYRQTLLTYEKELESYRSSLAALDREKAALSTKRSALTLGKPISEVMALWNSQLHLREALSQKKIALHQAEAHEQTLRAVLKPVPAPETPDTLTYPEEETASRLRRTTDALLRSERELQQLSGQLRLLGEKETYNRALSAVSARINALLEHYDALTLALETAQTASENLQRRFAPAISQEAERLFSLLTDGRYEKLLLSRDFTVEAAAEGETTLRSSRFRSDGTIDQLYLALRLAVAKTLSPTAPLVLDDALVRFDDARLRAAVTLLQAEAKEKQVLLFTCQSREQLIVDN